MEIYGGPPNQQEFYVGGITNEQKKLGYKVFIKELDDMVIHTLAFMANKFNCKQVLLEIYQHSEQHIEGQSIT